MWNIFTSPLPPLGEEQQKAASVSSPSTSTGDQSSSAKDHLTTKDATSTKTRRQTSRKPKKETWKKESGELRKPGVGLKRNEDPVESPREKSSREPSNCIHFDQTNNSKTAKKVGNERAVAGQLSKYLGFSHDQQDLGAENKRLREELSTLRKKLSSIQMQVNQVKAKVACAAKEGCEMKPSMLLDMLKLLDGDGRGKMSDSAFIQSAVKRGRKQPPRGVVENEQTPAIYVVSKRGKQMPDEKFVAEGENVGPAKLNNGSSGEKLDPANPHRWQRRTFRWNEGGAVVSCGGRRGGRSSSQRVEDEAEPIKALLRTATTLAELKHATRKAEQAGLKYLADLGEKKMTKMQAENQQ